ncbi:unnamed protein product [Rhodiola kirilowii]
MGRGRGKGRKLNGHVNHEDCGSGEEEKIPVQKKRGRPVKHFKEEVRNKTEKDDRENSSSGITGKHKSPCDVLKKRKRKYESKDEEKDEEKSEPVKEESGNETKSSSIDEEPVKPSGFRLNSRKRKNKPRRAAEAVVDCR